MPRERRRPRRFEDGAEDIEIASHHKRTRRYKTTAASVPEEVVQAETHWLDSTNGWQSRARAHSQWKTRCAAFVKALVCCSVCGICAFGTSATSLPPNWTSLHLDEPPAYPFAHPLMVSHMRLSEQSDTWHHCHACAAGTGFQSSAVTLMTPSYHAALSKVPPVLLQGLSCVDTAMAVKQKYRAYVCKRRQQQSLYRCVQESSHTFHAAHEKAALQDGERYGTVRSSSLQIANTCRRHHKV